MKRIVMSALFIFAVACAPAPATPPADISIALGEEFTLVSGQSAILQDAGLKVTFKEILSDGRCPLDIECAESGPVTLAVTLQVGSEAPQELVFQTFTNDVGNVPEMEFQGMQTGVEIGDLLLQVRKVMPFPASSAEIKPDEYAVSFLVTK